ncbi:MAG: hypothetical protein K5857_03410 [Lachnospiraceae bacterium]|nr:hypothetical protein [Lachnospiraceae bacterium]
MRKMLLRALIRLSILFVVFVITALVTSRVLNQGNTDLTTEMKKAGLPVIYVNVNGEYINCLHGYVSEMEGSFLRGNITPMSADRTIPVKIKTFGSVVTDVGYEVRTMDMQRLLENTSLSTFEYKDDEITAVIPVKDLIEDEQEYMLVIKLALSDGRTASYYCRFIDKPELYLTEKLDFVRNFSSSTFDKAAAEDIRKYMESNSEGDNSSYGYVNIHSSFNQLTWGDLEPVLESDKELRILDIDSRDAAIKLYYTVSAKGEMYDVEEYFYLTRGSDRIYLMDYERTMDKVIDTRNVVVGNGKIFHGILSDVIDYKENPEAGIFCFVQERSLYSYDSDTNSISRVFSFRDEENDDVRTSYKMHNIKILYVDENGNIIFAVYGYMNRGTHEGEAGIAIYNYDSLYNTIEERMFIPYTKSYEILKHDVENLCYVNRNGAFYILFNGTIYSIDLETTKTELLASGLNETRFVSSYDNSMIGWQPADNLYDYKTLKFMSLNAMVPVEISAEPGHILIPLGFFNRDFVYGSVKVSDIRLDSTGRTVLPMDYIYIQSLGGEILKTYHHDGIYVTDVEFNDNIMNLKRSVIDASTNLFYQTGDDQIMNNETGETSQNVFRSLVTEEMETTWQTELTAGSSADKPKVLTTKEVIYEGNRYFYLNVKDILDRYYVYSKGEIVAIFTDASDAVYAAENENGTVTNKECRYIWKSNDRKSKHSIENVGATVADGAELTKSTMAVCLDEMMKTAGVYVDTAALLKEGRTALDIMKDNMDNAVPLALTGCSTDAMLYYVGISSPVLAIVEDEEAVLIVGYDENSLMIYDPREGKTIKKSLRESASWFSSNGNRFLTYAR